MLTQHDLHEGDPLRFLRKLYGENATGNLAIWSRQDRRTLWVPANDLGSAAQQLSVLAERQDVYFAVGLQPRDLGPHRRGEGKDVIGIPGFWADVDVRGPAHKALDLPPTKEAALDLLGEFPLPPSLVVDSGHGLQPWWLFEEPWIFRDASERREAQALARRLQEALRDKAAAHGWRIDNVSDLSRVMRPPGTLNHKLGDRVLVRILEVGCDAR